MLPPAYPMKTSENQWLSDLFKGYEKEILTRNGYDIYKQILLWLYNENALKESLRFLYTQNQLSRKLCNPYMP